MSQASLIPTASKSPIFNFKTHEIRTIMQDGQPWFVARDVCAALALTWTGKTLSQIPDSWQRMCNLHIRRGNYEVRIISEPAVYKLAFRSNKDEADEFTTWVASDVLPAIRKTGKFDVAATPKRGRPAKALPPAAPLYVDRLHLTPWDRVNMGKEAVAILERAGSAGPRTLECILLKLRYLDALHDMLKLTNQLAADLDRVRKGVFGKIVQAGNVAGGCFTDPIMDILCDDTYHLRKLGDELHTTAFRGLNASICGARMLGV